MSQTIFRNKSHKHFTVISNELLNDPRLYDRALALLVYLLSKPEDWHISMDQLARGGRFGSRDTLTKTTRTLRELGYMELRRFADGSVEWSVYDTPQGGPAEVPPDPGKAARPGAPEPHSPEPAEPDPENAEGIQKTEDLQKTEELPKTPSPEGVSSRPATAESTPRSRQTPPAVDLPPWLPATVWAGFVEHRQKLRVPLTHKAITLALNKLAELREGGEDPVAVIEQSILNGYRGLFAVARGYAHGRARDIGLYSLDF